MAHNTRSQTSPTGDDVQIEIQPFSLKEWMRQQAEIQTPAPPPRTRGVKPPKCDDETDVGEYLVLFDAIVQQNEWTEEEAGIQLRCCLLGEHRKLAYQFPQYGYRELQQELRERFSLDEAGARTQLSQLVWDKRDSPATLADKIRKLVRIAYGRKYDANGIAEEEMERFLEKVDDPVLAGIFHSSGTNNLRAALATMKVQARYGKPRQSSRPALRALNEDPATPSDECRLQRLENTMQALTNSIPDKLGETSKTEKREVKCFFCGGNHFVMGCPTKPRNRNRPHKGDNQKPTASGNA